MCVATAAFLLAGNLGTAGVAGLFSSSIAGVSVAGISTGMSVIGFDSMLLSGASTAMPAYSQYQQGKYNEGLADYNAAVARNNAISAEYQAKDAEARGKTAEQEHRDKIARLKASQRTAIAGSGFDLGFGSAVDTVADTAQIGEMDALTIRHNSAMEAWGYRNQANDYTAQAGGQSLNAQAASNTGLLNATGSLLTGSSKVADKWYRYTR